MIRVTFGPSEGKSKYLFGKVFVDGVDISSRVGSVRFTRDQHGETVLDLRLFIHPEDAIDLEVPEEHVRLEALVFKGGEPIEAQASGDEARPYLAAVSR